MKVTLWGTRGSLPNTSSLGTTSTMRKRQSSKRLGARSRSITTATEIAGHFEAQRQLGPQPKDI